MPAPLGFDLPSDELRRLGRLAVDAAVAHRDAVEAGPPFGSVGEQAGVFDEPLPEEGLAFEEVLAFVTRRILPHPFGNSHPRHFAFIDATPDPVGAVADYLAATMNSNCWGGDHAAIHVEDRVVKWMAQLVGLPSEAEGIVTSGGSMANFTCLAAARRAQAPGDVREEGMGAPGAPRMVVYASDQVHSCVDKAVDLLGIGWRQLRTIPTDERFRMRIDLLKAAVAEDRRLGLLPAIVVANAGTVNTGAIDPLEEIADLCRQEGLWFHADGAYGAMAAVSHQLRPLFKGLERADSVAADPHKWLYVPYAAGIALVREAGRLAAAFRRPVAYLEQDSGGPMHGPVRFDDRGPELSRPFRALKVWMGLKVHGRRAYAARVESDVALARFLAAELDGRTDLELLSEPVLSIVTFRYRPPGLDEAALGALNRRIVNHLARAGRFALAPTLLKGRLAIRVCIVNFRTTRPDLVALLDDVQSTGRLLLEQA